MKKKNKSFCMHEENLNYYHMGFHLINDNHSIEKSKKLLNLNYDKINKNDSLNYTNDMYNSLNNKKKINKNVNSNNKYYINNLKEVKGPYVKSNPLKKEYINNKENVKTLYKKNKFNAPEKNKTCNMNLIKLNKLDSFYYFNCIPKKYKCTNINYNSFDINNSNEIKNIDNLKYNIKLKNKNCFVRTNSITKKKFINEYFKNENIEKRQLTSNIGKGNNLKIEDVNIIKKKYEENIKQNNKINEINHFYYINKYTEKKKNSNDHFNIKKQNSLNKNTIQNNKYNNLMNQKKKIQSLKNSKIGNYDVSHKNKLNHFDSVDIYKINNKILSNTNNFSNASKLYNSIKYSNKNSSNMKANINKKLKDKLDKNILLNNNTLLNKKTSENIKVDSTNKSLISYFSNYNKGFFKTETNKFNNDKNVRKKSRKSFCSFIYDTESTYDNESRNIYNKLCYPNNFIFNCVNINEKVKDVNENNKDSTYYIRLLLKGEDEAKSIIDKAYENKRKLKKIMDEKIEEEIDLFRKKEQLKLDKISEEIDKEIVNQETILNKKLKILDNQINKIFANVKDAAQYVTNKIIKVDTSLDVSLLKNILPIENLILIHQNMENLNKQTIKKKDTLIIDEFGNSSILHYNEHKNEETLRKYGSFWTRIRSTKSSNILK